MSIDILDEEVNNLDDILNVVDEIRQSSKQKIDKLKQTDERISKLSFDLFFFRGEANRKRFYSNGQGWFAYEGRFWDGANVEHKHSTIGFRVVRNIK